VERFCYLIAEARKRAGKGFAAGVDVCKSGRA
jgi:hypothetical protein